MRGITILFVWMHLAQPYGDYEYPCKDLNLDNRFRKPAFYPIELQGQRRHYNTITQNMKLDA